jgi:flagellar FliL protein
MADETFDEEGLGEGGGESSKKLVLFVVLPLLLLIGAGVGVTLMLGVFDSAPPATEEAHGDGHGDGQSAGPPPPPAQTESIFFPVPDMIVNLNTSGRKSTFLKIKVELELTNQADVEIVNKMLTRIVDNFQVYLRELRIEDLQGSAGLHRLREELLRRVNLAVRPARVQAVLFKEMLVQ